MNTATAPNPAKPDIAPEVPAEVEAKAGFKTEIELDPKTGEIKNPPPDPVAQTNAARRKAFFKKFPAVAREKKIKLGADGLPPFVPGMTVKKQLAIRAKQYPGAPAMSSTFGDLTPAFVEWLYLTYPGDAAVRYYGRQHHLNS